VFALVADKLFNEQWSPERIEGRLALELGASPVSDTTIYRTINAGRFDACIGSRKARRRLRHRGKRHRGTSERRGRIKTSHEISERPQGADDRSEPGHWEGDTVAGKAGGACLLTLVDRRDGFLVGGKCRRKSAKCVRARMRKTLAGQPLASVTLDRGKEFASHAQVTAEMGVVFYFALPHHPWQRRTNENVNGLLREYFPKRESLGCVSEKRVQEVYDKLSCRPRKRLGYRTPYGVHCSEVLHLI
jgi:IS30 family transposase